MCKEAPPVIGCSPPHQHDGFLPDLLCLDCLLVLSTRGADVERRQNRGSQGRVGMWRRLPAVSGNR